MISCAMNENMPTTVYPERFRDDAYSNKSSPDDSDDTGRSQGPSASSAALSPRSREYLRLRVNARERQRMHDMNSALDALRSSMPYAQGPAVKKLSKMNTLLLARNYISLLTRTLDELRRLLVETHSRQALPWTPRLDAAMRNHEMYAQQQRYAEELVRREQQLLQLSQPMTSLGVKQRCSPISPFSQCKASGEFDHCSPRLKDDKEKRRSSSSPYTLLESTHSRHRGKVCAEKNKKNPYVMRSSRYVTANSSPKFEEEPPIYLSHCGDDLFRLRLEPKDAKLPPTSTAPSDFTEATMLASSSAAMLHRHLTQSDAFRHSLHSIPCPCPHCTDRPPTFLLPVDYTSAARLV